MKRLYFIILILYVLAPASAKAQAPDVEGAVQTWFKAYRLAGYKPMRAFAADSIKVDEARRELLIYANTPFVAQPFTPSRVEEIYTSLSRSLPQPYNTYRLTIFGNDSLTLDDFIPNALRGDAADRSRLWGPTEFKGNPWVQRASRPYTPTAGLQGRHLMLWPSHGRYWAETKWAWQRPFLFCTTEDLYTQSFVNPFLLPMLENAGAVVCSPRERDYQTAEAVVDNDAPQRGGLYTETQTDESRWASLPDSSGFAQPRSVLSDSIQPFRLGTARFAVASQRKGQAAAASWAPRIPRRGMYAVYVSYASRANSVPDARYTVYHAGGRTQFVVNQQIGGGTWVYLGTFLFDEGLSDSARVVLSAQSNHRGIVTADAVRFGGGMGLAVRTGGTTTGLPRYLEAARYYAQWAGLPDSLYNQPDGDNDYRDDIRVRSNFLNYLGGGSVFMPHRTGQGVPFELSLAVHSDAGWRADNTPYGTLGICTTHDGEGNAYYGSGLSRRASADLAGMLIESCVGDIEKTFSTDWPRREMWDRNYAETRTPDVPSAILETMSHQNFRDLSLGHDPWFKFTYARSIYKALLRFSATMHGQPAPVVQPLPPHAFATSFTSRGDSVRLSWQPTADPIEPSATAHSYGVYTAMGDGGFDNGRVVRGSTSVTLPLQRGTRYAFRVTAVNDGGESFPSETLAAYLCPQERGRVLIVNGFDRLSGPANVCTPDSIGFDLDADIGVPYMVNTSLAGRQLSFDPQQAGKEGEGALGFCGDELVGKAIAGNTFDYPVAHGRAIASAGGFSFCSQSREAAEQTDWTRYAVVDYLAGLNRDVPYNLRPYRAIPATVRQRMQQYVAAGGGLLVGGAYVASDQRSDEEKAFVRNVLHCESAGVQRGIGSKAEGFSLTMPIYSVPCEAHYALQSADVLQPTAEGAFPAMLNGMGQPAAVAWQGKRGATFVTSIPLECISSDALQADAMYAILTFLTSK